MTTKEPWQMTKSEFIESSLIDVSGGEKAIKRNLESASIAATHKQVVQQALSEGKPVPPEVLKDYPDLVENVPTSLYKTPPGRHEVNMANEFELSEQAFLDITHKLEQDQRGKPESAMLRIQYSQIAQLYGWIAEHTGDISNRMSEDPHFFRGNFGAVLEKVNKVLRTLHDPYGFEREFKEQISHNLPYLNKEKDAFMGTPKYKNHDAALAELKKLGQAYADEHKKLVVANEAQKTARDAAIAIGEFRFKDAISLLNKLKEKLDQGPEAWKNYALSSVKPPEPPIGTIPSTSPPTPSTSVPELGKQEQPFRPLQARKHNRRAKSKKTRTSTQLRSLR